MRLLPIFLLIVALGTGVFFLTRSKSQNLTSPQSVNSLTGQIEKIDGNTLTVVQNGKKYRVKVTDKIVINGPIQALPFSLQSGTPPQPIPIKISDLKAGQIISINTDTDLRKNISEFTASSIQLSQTINTLSGKVIEIKDNQLILRTAAFRSPEDLKDAQKAANLPLEKDYSININSDTQFFKLSEKASFEDLEKDIQITVYSDTDVTTTDQLTAAYIEIAPTLPANPAAESSSVSTPQPPPNQ